METRIAKIVSYVFHPLLLPTYGILLFFQLDLYASWIIPSQKLSLLLFINLFTFLLPLLNVLLLLRYRYISSMHLPTKEERRLPLLITTFFYAAAYYLIRNTEVSETLKLLLLGAVLSVILTALINLFWKISIHMMGLGTLVGVIYTVCCSMYLSAHYLMALLILLAALVAFSRLQLSAHSPGQVYAGFIIGFFSQILLLF